MKTINEFTYEHSERLGDAFEYLLSVLGSQGDAGQFRTPRHIIDFMVSVVQPRKNETILDPACGTAGFLISAYKHILKENTKKTPGDLLTPDERKRLLSNFKGYDISPDMVRLSLVNLYLHGFVQPQIFEYDTLTSEDRWNEYADVILANPPFMSPKGGIKPHKRFSVQSNRSEVLFVDYMAEHLSPTGRAGIIVPEGIIFQSANAYKQLRKYLVDNEYLWAVVSLPAGIFNPYSGVKTSILLLDKTIARKTDQILFVKVENDGFNLGAQRRPIEKNDLPDAANVLTDWQKVVRNGNPETFIIEEKPCGALLVEKTKLAEIGDYNLTGDRYRQAEVRTHQKWPMEQLGEVSTFISKGTTPTTMGYNFENRGINFIKIESITENGNFIESKFAYISKDCYEQLKRSQLKENDVLFSIAGAFGRVAVVNNKILPANTNQALAIIRPDNNIIDSYFLSLVLRSDQVLREIEVLKTGVAQYNISLTQITNLKIPLPHLEVQREIVAEIEGYQKIIDGARQVVENWKPKIDIDPYWPMLELGEVCAFEYGYTATAQEKGDVRFIRITDIDESGNIKPDGEKFIDLTTEASEYLLKKGDLLVARTGATYGKTTLFSNDYKAIFASYLIRLKLNSTVLPKYYWYFAQSTHYWEQSKTLVSGGGQPQFNANAIRQIKIPVPPFEVQRDIVAGVEAEQKLVDGNRKLMSIYEEKIKKVIDCVWEG